MKRALIFLCGLLMVGALPALADDAVHHAPSVIGKKARKQIRAFYYQKNLRNDKRRVYDEYGYTPHRLRINEAGKLTERWTYYNEGLEFTFDQGGKLVETREIAREDRRSWEYQSWYR